MLKAYYELTKPGLVWGNLIPGIAGYLYACRWQVSWPHFLGTIAGTALVIASACVFNNLYDREADAKMPRTQQRPLVTGVISPRGALVFGDALAAIGFACLLAYAGLIAALVALFACVVYVLLYSPLKYRSHWGAVVGTFAGAAPVVIGYAAVTNRIDLAAAILFAILVIWQLPHFYAIALYRKADYAAAGIPVLSIGKIARAVKAWIIALIALYVIIASMLSVLGFAGMIYRGVVILFGTIWFALAYRGLWVEDDARWARGVFLMSLVVMVTFSFALAIASITP